jgi:hypothetical protein
MKEYGGVDLKVHVFLTSALVVTDRSDMEKNTHTPTASLRIFP